MSTMGHRTENVELTVEELDKMDRIRDEKVFYPYYPKCIVDGWDYKAPLAKKLLDILDIYVRL